MQGFSGSQRAWRLARVIDLCVFVERSREAAVMERTAVVTGVEFRVIYDDAIRNPRPYGTGLWSILLY